MAKKISPETPSEIPVPSETPDLQPTEFPETPTYPEEEPEVDPDRDPQAPTPGIIPPGIV